MVRGVVRCPSVYSSVIPYQQNQYLLANIAINVVVFYCFVVCVCACVCV